jgi:hypothetical protein
MLIGMACLFTCDDMCLLQVSCFPQSLQILQIANSQTPKSQLAHVGSRIPYISKLCSPSFTIFHPRCSLIFPGFVKVKDSPPGAPQETETETKAPCGRAWIEMLRNSISCHQFISEISTLIHRWISLLHVYPKPTWFIYIFDLRTPS